MIGRSGPLIGVDSNQLCVSSGFEFATVTNTDRLVVHEFVTDIHDGVTIDESNGEFAPGFAPEADGHSEIEIVVSKAGGVADNGRLNIIGTPGNDVIRIARGAVSLQRDLQAGQRPRRRRRPPGTPRGGVTVEGSSGSRFPVRPGVRRAAADAVVSRPGRAAPGDDKLFGGTQGDYLFGEGDNDTLNSVEQVPSDFVSGGSGFDNAIHDAIDNLDGIESGPTG